MGKHKMPRQRKLWTWVQKILYTHPSSITALSIWIHSVSYNELMHVCVSPAQHISTEKTALRMQKEHLSLTFTIICVHAATGIWLNPPKKTTLSSKTKTVCII